MPPALKAPLTLLASFIAKLWVLVFGVDLACPALVGGPPR